MRTYGRIYNSDGTYKWVEVTTDANGDHSNVWLTTLAQTLRLNLGESPFYANYGIPAYQSVVTQVMPDYYAMKTQQQFSGHFASLIIAREPGSFPPVYNVTAVCNSGAILTAQVAT